MISTFFIASHRCRTAAIARAIILVFLGFLSLVSASAMSAEPTLKNIEYAIVDGHSLKLDVYQTTNVDQRAPLLVWVHGGAWRSGSKENMPVAHLVEHGFTIASVNYRLSPQAPFPANVHDIKAAIRFMKGNADRFGILPDQVFIAGNSAGGHLAALVGVTNGLSSLEGDVGNHPTQSSDVHGIVSFYGASNLQSILSQSTPHGLSVRVPALNLLLGGPVEQNKELAELASPVTHVNSADPPLLLIHGDQDPQMPINQAHELHGRYKTVGRPVEFRVIHGGVHGGKGFFENSMLDEVARFLKQTR